MDKDKEMKDLEQQIGDLRQEQQNLWAKQKPIQERLVAIYDEISLCKEKLAELTYANSPLDWKHVLRALADDAINSQYLLRRVEKELHEQFDMWHSGYWNDTREANFELKVARNPESVKKNVAGLKFFAPLLTPHEEDGRVWFGVFEHTLSSRGSYKITATQDLTSITLTRNWQQDVDFSSPEEAVQYIHDHHWYGDRDQLDDDE